MSPMFVDHASEELTLLKEIRSSHMNGDFAESSTVFTGAVTEIPSMDRGRTRGEKWCSMQC